jgi:hypothetical protein
MDSNLELRTIPLGLVNNYKAGSDGNIYSFTKHGKGKRLKPRLYRGKYYRVNVVVDSVHKTYPVHKLVCMSIHKDRTSEGLLVRHLDDNPIDNLPSNLRWGTSQDNSNDAIKNGKTLTCEKNHQVKLTRSEVDRLRELRNVYKTPLKELSVQFGISKSQISAIANYKSWK